MPSTNKALRNNDVVTGTMSSKSSSILADHVDIVQKLTLHSFENEDIHISYLIEILLH